MARHFKLLAFLFAAFLLLGLLYWGIKPNSIAPPKTIAAFLKQYPLGEPFSPLKSELGFRKTEEGIGLNGRWVKYTTVIDEFQLTIQLNDTILNTVEFRKVATKNSPKISARFEEVISHLIRNAKIQIVDQQILPKAELRHSGMSFSTLERTNCFYRSNGGKIIDFKGEKFTGFGRYHLGYADIYHRCDSERGFNAISNRRGLQVSFDEPNRSYVEFNFYSLK